MKFLSVFYHDLKNRGNGIPYFSTIIWAAFNTGLHIFQLTLILNLPSKFFHFVKLNNHRQETWVNSIILFTPIFFIMNFLIRKRKLEQFHFESSEIKKGMTAQFIYVALSISLLIALLVLKSGR